MWRYRGTNHHLIRQAARLGVPKTLADRAVKDRLVHHIGTLLAQLCERVNRAKRENDRPVFPPHELAQLTATLGQCELAADQLHVAAAASHSLLDEAWIEIGQAPPPRHFLVLSDIDHPTNAVPGNNQQLITSNYQRET